MTRITFADLAYAGGFTVIPDTVMLNPHLSAQARLMYVFLANRSWSRGYQDMESMEVVNYIGGSTAAAVVELERNGLVVCDRVNDLISSIEIIWPFVKEQVIYVDKSTDDDISRAPAGASTRGTIKNLSTKELALTEDNPNRGKLLVPEGLQGSLPKCQDSTPPNPSVGSPKVPTESSTNNNELEPRIVFKREPNLAFEALCKACGIGVTDKQEDKMIASALARIRSWYAKERNLPEQDIDSELPAEIFRRAKLYRMRWDTAELTPTALAKHWYRVTTPMPGQNRSLETQEILKLGREMDERGLL